MVVLVGAGRGNRTPTGLHPKVFETFASASSAIPASGEQPLASVANARTATQVGANLDNFDGAL